MNAFALLFNARCQRAVARSRRGVLLLVVLSMLTLFMMLGVAYVIMASRARDSSRAFSRAITQERFVERGDSQLLEQALLLLVRGPDPLTPPAQQPGPLKQLADGQPVTNYTFSFESLLEDMYGNQNALAGRTSGAFGWEGPTCWVDLAQADLAPPPAGPLELTGRIISFLRESGRITSHRILRAEPTADGYRVFVANHGDVFRASRPPAEGDSLYDFPPPDTAIRINGRAHSGQAPGSPVAWNEPWDGYDFEDSGGNPTNPFLSHIEPIPSNPSSSSVVRFSMHDGPGIASPVMANADLNGDSIPDYCDNDGDGVLDGQFFDPGFQPIPLENGAERRVDVSCLIVDLDGRLNVNAHGSLASMLYPPGFSGWPASLGATDPLPELPPGSGYGPAEINVALAFDDLLAERPIYRPDVPAEYDRSLDPWLSVLGGAVLGKQYAAGSLNSQPDSGCRAVPPAIGPLEGRYGELPRARAIDRSAGANLSNYRSDTQAMPGVESINDNERAETQFLDPDTGRTVRPIDLHGRLKHRMVPSGGSPRGVVPTLEYFRPDNPSDVDDLTDDPYEVNLVSSMGGGRAVSPRTGGLRYSDEPADNRFSVAELERILRPYDADSYRLPQRLFVLLGPHAEAGRLLCTSESWSIPAITGQVAEDLFGPNSWWQKVWEKSSDNEDQGILFSKSKSITEPRTAESIPDGLVPVDIAAGLKLDIAPVLHTNLQRRALFKDLYLLGVALTNPATDDPDPQVAARIAQWAANVVEFQDADSTMTLYEYDPEPANGWSVDGDPVTTNETPRAIVWGGERPDVIITQALAWENPDTNEGQLYVVLHRPLKSNVLTPSDDPDAPPAAEPIDPNLRGTEPDQVDLGKLTPLNNAVWRLKIESGNSAKILRFDDAVGNEAEDPNLLGATTPEPSVRTFAAHQWLCVMPSGVRSSVGVAAQLETFTVDIGSLRAVQGATVVDIRLERLADPTKEPDSDEESPDYNPYIVVDSMTIPQVVNRRVDPLDPATPLPFEKFTRVGWASGSPRPEQGDPIEMTADWLGEAGWFPWPDRPLIGITELLFVPGFALNTYRPVPASDPAANGLFESYQPPTRASYLPDQRILEVVRVPSRYTGTRISVNTATQDDDAQARIDRGLADLGLAIDIRPANQIDLGREPGLVNLNTISSNATWKAVVQGGVLRNEAEAHVDTAISVPGRASDPNATHPPQGASNPANFLASPAQKLTDLLSLSVSADPANPALPYEDSTDDIADADTNPWHRITTATRLANMATIRSHVFGIWITVRTIDYSYILDISGNRVFRADPDTVRYSRMFVIYDRSKPVAYEPGKDHNVADGILLKRVLP